MVSKDDIERVVNARLSRLLQAAEIGLSHSQFQAFRKFALDEFGNNGLNKDLARLFHQHQGTARHGQE